MIITACVSPEGVYLPPFCIMKGKNLKKEYADGLFPADVVNMDTKLAYMNSDIFMD